MKKVVSIFLVTLLASSYSFGQTKIDEDKQAIKSMCGCYEVGFNFIETFNYSDDSTYTKSYEKHSDALEWVGLLEDSEGKVSIQHLLIVEHEEEEMIIKHWRQDWLYENTGFYMFDRDNKWLFQEKNADEVAGQWTQKVYQVDDGPRYEGSSSWVHVDGKSYWENTTDAPLPRREYTQRSDYNVTVRSNRHEITEDGWIHEQDNKKVVREDGSEDQVLAEEKGYNTYVRVEDSKCQTAKTWWEENGAFWSKARVAWETIYDKEKDLELEGEVEGKHIYDILFGMDLTTDQKEILKELKTFIK
ncbi:MAG: hypothetical protein ACJASQ_000009 [Crocinitomicaceae bacterium]|jgi:hypothetical protein